MKFLKELLQTLKNIEKHLAEIKKTCKKLDECISDNNHKKQPCIKTGHWNDN